MEAINKLQAALAWLERGAALLPAQPGTKQLVSGFGPHRKKITELNAAAIWFGSRSKYNLAVCLPGELLGLDFDSDKVFMSWVDQLPAELVTTYHETTPRGFHVFYRCSVPKDVKLIQGVEIKRVLISSPSVVKCFRYTAIDYPILWVEDWQDILSPLLSKEQSSKDFPGDGGSHGRRPASSVNTMLATGDDLISQIKHTVNIREVASSLTKLSSSDHGRGRWWVGLCPFHDDQQPSFWVDAERGLWGCHACNVRGDVINLYAQSKGLTILEAIKDLAREVTA